MKQLAIAFIVSLVGSCAPKVLILQTPVVSMTKNSTEPGAALKEGEEVNTKWCSGDEPVVENDDGSKQYGMIDQAIHKAHKEHKADFFMNNRFYQQQTCVIMQANVAKVGGGGGAAKSDAEAAPASEKKPKKAKKKK
jgi:hypothetical protein